MSLLFLKNCLDSNLYQVTGRRGTAVARLFRCLFRTYNTILFCSFSGVPYNEAKKANMKHSNKYPVFKYVMTAVR